MRATPPRTCRPSPPPPRLNDDQFHRPSHWPIGRSIVKLPLWTRANIWGCFARVFIRWKLEIARLRAEDSSALYLDNLSFSNPHSPELIKSRLFVLIQPAFFKVAKEISYILCGIICCSRRFHSSLSFLAPFYMAFLRVLHITRYYSCYLFTKFICHGCIIIFHIPSYYKFPLIFRISFNIEYILFE